MDLYPYIYHSHPAQHLEFITRHPLDTEEHLKAQIFLARNNTTLAYIDAKGADATTVSVHQSTDREMV